MYCSSVFQDVFDLLLFKHDAVTMEMVWIGEEREEVGGDDDCGDDSVKNWSTCPPFPSSLHT